jgi:hypothetical protein
MSSTEHTFSNGKAYDSALTNSEIHSTAPFPLDLVNLLGVREGLCRAFLTEMSNASVVV